MEVEAKLAYGGIIVGTIWGPHGVRDPAQLRRYRTYFPYKKRRNSGEFGVRT